MKKLLTYRSLLGCSALAMLIASTHSFPAGAQTAPAAQNVQTFTFAVPQASLANVLTEIGRVGKVTVSVPSDLVAGRTAGPVNGTETVESALNKALAGTGLVAQRQPDGGYVVRKQSAALSGDVPAVEVTAPKQRPVPVPTQQAQAPAPTAPATNANGDMGFKPGDTGNLIGLQGVKIEKSPLSITGVTKDVIQSQQVTDARELARNVAGVVLAGEGVVIRGIQSKNSTSVIRVDGARADSLPNTETLERVEVLKGATSIFTGQTADAGVINFVKKAADGQKHSDLLLRYDSYFGATASIDVGDKIKGFKGLSTRFVAVGTLDGLSSGDYKNGEVLGSIDYKSDAFWQNFSLNYSKSFNPQRPYHYRVLDGSGIDIATERFKPSNISGGSTWGDLYTTFNAKQKQGLKLGQIAGTVVTVDHETSAQRFSQTARRIDHTNPQNPARAYTANNFDIDSLVDKVGLNFATKTSAFNNTLLVGHDYRKSWIGTRGTNVAGFLGQYDYGLADKPDFRFGTMSEAVYTNQGISITDQLDLFNDTLHLFGSIRKDWWEQITNGSSRFNNPGFPPFIPPSIITNPFNRGEQNDGVSRSFGAGYDVTNWATVFYNTSNGVKQGEFDNNKGVFNPAMTFDQWDSGMRFKLFKNSLTATVTYFENKRGNVNFQDPITQVTTLADITSRGTEFQVQGALMRNLQTNFALALTDANVRQVPGAGSLVTAGVAPVSGSLWNVYTFEEHSALKGFSLGFGVRGNSSTRLVVSQNINGQISRTWEIPAYLLADASIGYKIDNWDFNLKATNIFDTLAFLPSSSNNTLIPEQARTITLEARVKF